MNVRCETCGAIYRIDPAKVPAGGVRARCTSCSNIVAIGRAGAAADPAYEAAARRFAPRTEDRVANALGDAFIAPPPAEAPPVVPFESGEVRSPVVVGEPVPSTDEPPPSDSPEPPVPPETAAPVDDRPALRPIEASGPLLAPEPVEAVEPAATATPAPEEPPAASEKAEPAAPAAQPVFSGPRLVRPFSAPRGSPATPVRPPARPVAPVFRPTPGQPATIPPAPKPPPSPVKAEPIVRPIAPSPPPAAAAPPAPPPPAPAAPAAPSPSKAPAASETPTKPINPFLSRDPSQKARRLARALVSDMIVYQPEKRQRALREGNLKEAFDEEIKKSWEEYVEQVGQEIADSTDHFNVALNEILAGGDPIF